MRPQTPRELRTVAISRAGIEVYQRAAAQLFSGRTVAIVSPEERRCGMSTPPENPDAAEWPEQPTRITVDATLRNQRHERLASARAARARRDPGVGLLLISIAVASWVVIFLIFLVLWLQGVNIGNWPSMIGPSVVVVSLALLTR